MGGQQFATDATLRRHARAEPGPRVRSRARHHRGRGRHPVAGADRDLRHAAGRRAVGDRAEADRRRPADDRRRARGQRARPRADAWRRSSATSSRSPRRRRRRRSASAAATENRELFRLAIGGYGLFGVITSVDAAARAAPQGAARRRGAATSSGLMGAFDARIARRLPLRRLPVRDRRGVATTSCDAASSRATSRCATTRRSPAAQARALGRRLGGAALPGARRQARARSSRTSRYYLATSGQVYWSDLHQLAHYLDDYHAELDPKLGARARRREMITEIYVPRDRAAPLHARARRTSRRTAPNVDLRHGPADRARRRDLPRLGARPWACVIFNLHVEHTPAGIDAARGATFRALIDIAIEPRRQLLPDLPPLGATRAGASGYPQFAEFLRASASTIPRSGSRATGTATTGRCSRHPRERRGADDAGDGL